MKAGSIFSVEQLDSLTPKERTVLLAMHRLGSIQAVATELNNKVKTIDLHLASAKEKLGCTGESSHRIAALYTSAVADPPGVGQEPVVEAVREVLRPRRSTFAMVIPAALFGLVMVGWLNFGRQAGTSSPQTPEQIESKLVRLGADNSQQTARQSALLVGQLMRVFWQEMWGPKENYILAILERRQAAVRDAIGWTKVNDPDLHVRILGNGHRLMAQSSHFSDWPKLLDEAEAIAKTRDSVDYGRLLCGIAFAQWDLAPERGYQSATRARDLFAEVNGAEWDRANAIRHMGLCCRERPLPERIGYYREALAIYEKLGEPRGRTHCLLSLAQAGYSDKEPVAEGIEREGWAVKATHSARQLGNDRLISESTSQLLNLLQGTPLKSTPKELLVAMRNELESVSRRYHAGRQFRLAVQLRSECLRLDLFLQAPSFVASDLEAVLANEQRSPMDRAATVLLVTYYLWLCQNIRRPESEDITRSLRKFANSTATYSPPSHAALVEAARTLFK